MASQLILMLKKVSYNCSYYVVTRPALSLLSDYSMDRICYYTRGEIAL